MKKERLQDFVGGWFIGNFAPSLVRSEHFEVGVKHFLKGDSEPVHYQRTAWEVTVVISGECQIGTQHLKVGDVLLIEPLEALGFKALTDCTLVIVKAPSLPEDKVLGSPK